MEKEMKKKRTKKVAEYALKDGDWRTLSKFINSEEKYWGKIVQDHKFVECFYKQDAQRRMLYLQWRIL